jgi:hypothetical protein
VTHAGFLSDTRGARAFFLTHLVRELLPSAVGHDEGRASILDAQAMSIVAWNTIIDLGPSRRSLSRGRCNGRSISRRGWLSRRKGLCAGGQWCAVEQRDS